MFLLTFFFFLLILQLKGTKEFVETNGHSHEDANVGTTNLGFSLLATCWLNQPCFMQET
jgi:hypothetical protein